MSIEAVLFREAKPANDDEVIVRAIDDGGGQACDISGVIRALDAAGFVIVRKGLHQSLRRMVEAFDPEMRPIGPEGIEMLGRVHECEAAHAEASALAYPTGHLRDE